MVYISEEYPFHARWYRNGSLENDITSVNYVIYRWDEGTDDYVSIQSGTINSRDTEGRWVVPFTIPDSAFRVFKCSFTPVGGDWPPLEDHLDTRKDIFNLAGTETYSGTVCARDGNPIQGAIVQAIAYGTANVVQTAITDVNGDFELVDLPANFAYTVVANADGYIGKIADKVVF